MQEYVTCCADAERMDKEYVEEFYCAVFVPEAKAQPAKVTIHDLGAEDMDQVVNNITCSYGRKTNVLPCNE